MANTITLNLNKLDELSPEDLAALYTIVGRIAHDNVALAAIRDAGESVYGASDFQDAVNEHQLVYDNYGSYMGDIGPTGHHASEFYAEMAECRSALRHDKYGNSIQ